MTQFELMNALDLDPQETQEWQEAFAQTLSENGPERARYLLSSLAQWALNRQVQWNPNLITPHINTISADKHPA